MKELIDRKELIDNLNRYAADHFTALVSDLIAKQKSATCCADCKHYSEKLGWCDLIMMHANKDDYCAWAKKVK